MSKSCHDEGLSSEKNAGGAEDTIERRLAGSVDVVKVPLSDGVVHGDDGVAKVASSSHGSEAVNAGGGLFGSTNDALSVLGFFTVNTDDEVSTVVKG